MRRLAPAFLAVALVFTTGGSLMAQAGAPMHAPDFRAQERIAPLYFSPKPNAPFMAIAKTLWVRTLPDGSTVTTQNERVVARDMEGRVFQERRTFIPVPDDGKQQSQAYATEYTDPVAHAAYHCRPMQKTCELQNLFAQENNAELPAGLQPDQITFLTRENLGVDTVDGIEVQRSREVFTHYAQTIGNTKTILRTVDYWYSPQLGVNVKVVRHDPRDGDQTLWLSDISPTAADPETFKVPSDFKVFDHRMSRPTGRQPAANSR